MLFHMKRNMHLEKKSNIFNSTALKATFYLGNDRNCMSEASLNMSKYNILNFIFGQQILSWVDVCINVFLEDFNLKNIIYEKEKLKN